MEQNSKKYGPAPDASDLATEFLTAKGYRDNGPLRLRHWREDFYKFTGSHYRRVSQKNFHKEVLQWFHEAGYQHLCNTTKANNALLNVIAMTTLPEETELNSWLDGRETPEGPILSVKNGILSLNEALKGEANILPHSPSFYTFASLPFDYDPNAICPRWEAFLAEMLPDPEVIQFLQEWFGYNLIYDTKQEKFVLFVGEGANGKTVVCVVLKTLLGNENISAVSMEAFNPSNRFGLAATIGKLANVVEEMNEIEKAAEGNVKNFVTGSLMEGERKHKDSFPFYPTARLTFATNILPRFSDRSDGLWRRLITVPFDVRILDESKQDKRLLDSTFWLEEMPGILNWSLRGLANLKARGRFSEPNVCREFKSTFKRESNPAKTFLSENYEVMKLGKVSISELYLHYTRYTGANGCQALRQTEFSKEVGRVFPNAWKSKNALHQDNGLRSHVWYGIAPIIGSTPDTDDTNFSEFSKF